MKHSLLELFTSIIDSSYALPLKVHTLTNPIRNIQNYCYKAISGLDTYMYQVMNLFLYFYLFNEAFTTSLLEPKIMYYEP